MVSRLSEVSQIAIILAMRVSELGEFGLIDVLARLAPRGDEGHRILVGIGDDAAVWRSEDLAVLATTDTLVEGVHFTSLIPWRQLGWKALSAGLSDVAAMGGEPRYALIALSLTEQTEVEDVSQLYLGMADVAVQFGVAVVGGNVSRAAATTVTVTVIGRVKEDRMLTRSAAQPGDLIAVSGYLGSSAAGARMLGLGLEFKPETDGFLRSAHLRPSPRIACGRHFAAQGVRTAVDISDGLIADLNHVCGSSEVGAIVQADRIPIHEAVKDAFPDGYLDLALSGGEDYELLFTASPEIINGAMNSWAIVGDCLTSVIGEITARKGILVVGADGQPYPVVSSAGWDHFKKGA